MTKPLPALVLSVAALSSACGPPDLLADLPDAGPADAGPCAPGSNIVYVNQLPAMFRPGVMSDSVANTTPILEEEVTIDGPALADLAWQELMSCVRELFAPYDVTITDADPGDVDHTEIYVASSSEDLGLPSNIGSIVSSQCERGPRDLGFAFTSGNDFASNPEAVRQVCEGGVAWAVGAITGLSHSYRCEDAMSRLFGCGDKSFLDEDVECGQFEPETCRCGGAVQNTHQRLLVQLGPARCPDR